MKLDMCHLHKGRVQHRQLLGPSSWNFSLLEFNRVTLSYTASNSSTYFLTNGDPKHTYTVLWVQSHLTYVKLYQNLLNLILHRLKAKCPSASQLLIVTLCELSQHFVVSVYIIICFTNPSTQSAQTKNVHFICRILAHSFHFTSWKTISVSTDSPSSFLTREFSRFLLHCV